MAQRRHRWLLALLLGTTMPAAAADDLLGPTEVKLDQERLEPGLYPAAPGALSPVHPAEPAHPPFNIDWSVGLKGSYTSSSREGGSFLTTLNPQFSAVHEGVRTDLRIEGSAELAHQIEAGSPIELPALRLGLSTTTQLDSNTQLRGDALLTLNRDLASTPGLDPLIIGPAPIAAAALGLGVDRTFGRFTLSGEADLVRTLTGPTTRLDTGISDNSHQSLWEADGRLRLGYQATPIFEAFAEGEIGRDMFDAPSPALGVLSDATSRALRGGISGSWRGILTATASVGVGQHDFDAAGLADITTQLYDANITYSPDPTFNLTAQLSTDVEPTGADQRGTAKVEHRAELALAYTLNSWLRLRASAGWSESRLEGNGETERRSAVGAGLDYVLNSRAALSADYAYEHRNNSNSGLLDTHRIGVGITLRR